MLSIVAIAASTGGLAPLRQIVLSVPSTSTAAVFVVMHIGPYSSVLPELLKGASGLPATFAINGAVIEAGRIYVAPPDHHVLLERGWMRLGHGPKVNHTRPAADPLFISAAAAYRERVMGIVLSGRGSDGAEGLRMVKASGGRTIVQQPNEAIAPSMPLAALQRGNPDACLAVAEIALVVAAFCSV
ncbi:chemotaxis protein CheB [Falsiroseomonas sp. E2-1-a20]|uniref:chemotaxis protein CheB n=1 Tax=Falsiroseomonas sp. E2-1-a20 TaxID=3239300 RepID=UPI003F2F537E